MSKKSREGHYSDETFAIDDFSKMYKDYAKEGFKVSSVRSRINEMHEEEDIFRLETPYMYDGKPVTAYAVVATESQVYPEQRYYNTCELYVDGKNLEDVSGRNAGKAVEIDLKDKNGNAVDYNKALDHVGLFSAAASGYPHTMDYDEWAPIYEKSHDKINSQLLSLGEPTMHANPERYNKYVKTCVSMIDQGIPHIGPVSASVIAEHNRQKTEQAFYDPAIEDISDNIDFDSKHDGLN